MTIARTRRQAVAAADEMFDANRRAGMQAGVEHMIATEGGGLEGARWMRGHYFLCAHKDRLDPYELAAWLISARHAHRIVMRHVVASR